MALKIGVTFVDNGSKIDHHDKLLQFCPVADSDNDKNTE